MQVMHGAVRLLAAVSVMLAFGALSSQRAVMAAETGFQVSSYIPTYFRDFTWYVQGGASYNWNDVSRTQVNQPFSDHQFQTSDDRSSQGYANGYSYMQYRYETVKRIATFSCGLSGSVSPYKATGNQHALDTTGYVQASHDENKGHYYYFQASPSVSLTNYVNGEFLVGADLYGYVYYQRYPKNTNTSVSNTSTFPDSESAYQYTTTRMDNISEQPSTSKSYGFDGELSGGWGHIYYGRFAAATMYLVNELRSNGYLKQEPTESQMLQLTEIVYQQKLKHAVDGRIRLIEAQQAVMNYLKAEDIATTEDPLMPLVVQDVWNYFPSYDRAFGFQVRAGVGVEYDRSSSDRTWDASSFSVWALRHRDSAQALLTQTMGGTDREVRADRYTMTLPYLFGRMNYQKPIDLRWQLEVSADARLYISPNYVTRYDYQFSRHRWYEAGADTTWDTTLSGNGYVSEFNYKNMYTAYLNGRLRYIYNSRTSALLSAELGYGHFNQELTITETRVSTHDSSIVARKYTGPTFGNVRFALSLAMTYRMSIPTTLSASISYYTGYSPRSFIPNYYKYKPQNFSISASITHYIY